MALNLVVVVVATFVLQENKINEGGVCSHHSEPSHSRVVPFFAQHCHCMPIRFVKDQNAAGLSSKSVRQFTSTTSTYMYNRRSTQEVFDV